MAGAVNMYLLGIIVAGLVLLLYEVVSRWPWFK